MSTLPNNESNNESNNENYNISSWEDLDIDPLILRGIYSYGFEKPSPIQERAIKPIICGRDIIAQAQSGTGKTATFSIGALSKINVESLTTQVLILSPTKELSIQTENVIKSIGSMMKGLKVESVFGGVGGFLQSGKNPFKVKSQPQSHIICACPGKLLNMLDKRIINLNNLKLVILDEADEMLSTGFKEQVYDIFQFFSEDIQVALFSATLPNSVFPIIDKIMRNPVNVLVKSEMLTLEGIQQFYVCTDDDSQKFDTLKHIFTYLSVSQSIIYCNSVKRVIDLYEAMKDEEFPVCCIHGQMDKEERLDVFNAFKNGKYRVLISTNLTSRGIDIQQISVVINFDMAHCIDNYLHRIGRSGRWGRKGFGINFVTRRDISQLKQIESHYDCEIKEMPSDLSFIKLF